MTAFLDKKEVKEAFDDNEKKVYDKKGDFIFRRAQPGETVLTIVSGKLETYKTAGADEVVLRNMGIGSSAEVYIISGEKFRDRYAELKEKPTLLIDGLSWEFCKPTGSVEAFQWHGATFEFLAPWGEKMLCEDGDWIAKPVNGDEFDIYRIERLTFEQTYGEQTIN